MINEKRRGKLSQKIFFNHDNAAPHKLLYQHGSSLILIGKCSSIPISLYSRVGFFKLPHISKSQYVVSRQHFENEEALKTAVNEFFTKPEESWYVEGINKLVARYEKCLE